MKNIKLSTIAYRKIKSMIMNDEFEKKSMTQSELVKELNMSRTPIVSALQILSSEGFIKNESRKGIIIRELSITEINELYNARIALEIYSIKNISKDSIIDFKNLEEIIQEQIKSIKKKDFYKFAEMDSAFHKELVEINENKVIAKINKNIADRTFFHRNLVSKSSNLNQFVSDHIEIIEALKQQDFVLAATITEEHIKSGKIIF